MPSATREERLLLMEGDPDLRRVVAESLERFGWHVDPVGGQEEALEVLEREPQPDILILEFDASQKSTERVIDRYRELTSARGKVLMTTDDRPTDERRRKILPDAIIYKPYDVRYLIKSIDKLTDQEA